MLPSGLDRVSAAGFNLQVACGRSADVVTCEQVVRVAHRPVALMLVSVLHFFTGDDQVRQIAGPLIDALPPGSYVTAAHATSEFVPATVEAGRPTPAAAWTSSGGTTTRSRTSSSGA